MKLWPGRTKDSPPTQKTATSCGKELPSSLAKTQNIFPLASQWQLVTNGINCIPPGPHTEQRGRHVWETCCSSSNQHLPRLQTRNINAIKYARMNTLPLLTEQRNPRRNIVQMRTHMLNMRHDMAFQMNILGLGNLTELRSLVKVHIIVMQTFESSTAVSKPWTHA